MAKRPIIWAPDPVLKTKCTPVSAVDDEIRALMDDMLDTMYAAPGIGLAAPQVGVTKRVIVVDVSEKDEPNAPICLANPEIVWKSDETAPHEEGCLSLPDLYADVERPVAVQVRYLDRDGASQELAAEGLLAICLQHEIDHIDGILFVDHLSALKRNMFLKKMVKAKKTRAREEAA
ncbi:peptide deformylase [Thalassobaculum litoreum]|uniref:Peptide deformylase n=1 Tax=Thalassobaculum litoreum DSM 18839 TaxID=1123362 RepID=A0A8G2BME0_9PROT|nr:peptide deformylase [Thalassobaculum litoreum]SDG21347.1 peptide deformylase [Thalassobaculum litoreum DSM 18839]